MLKNKGLAFKQCFYILSIAAVIFISIFLYNYYVTKTIIVNKLQEDASVLSKSANRKIEQVFISSERIARTISIMLKNYTYTDIKLRDFLTSIVSNHSEIYGSCIAFAPYEYNKNIEYYAAYAYRKKDNIDFIDLSKSYNYIYWNWYQIPKELKKAVWSEPYYDKGAGNAMMTTYSVPFYKKTGGKQHFLGVATVDISLMWLRKYIRSLKVHGSGYAFLISKTGRIISYPNPKYIMNESIFSLAEARGEKNLRLIGRKMIKGETGFIVFKSLQNGQKGWLYYAPVEFTNWSLGVFFPENELLAGFKKLNFKITFLSLAGLFILFILIVVITHRITAPLRKLAKASDSISAGDFNQKIPMLSKNDEIGLLTASFETMRKALIDYIRNLKETTAAKERMESELNVAHKIQMSIIPNKFPAFPDNSEFDIYAAIHPAKAVGGDLYDFFMLGDNKLCFVIGDVSGKGVPAALFMAVTRTLLRAKSDVNLKPGEILTRMNTELCIENESAMFVTFFCCLLDLESGRMEFSNAGHNKPLIIRTEGRINTVKEIHGAPLGLFDDSEYDTGEIILNKGDRIVLYTDGITEALGKKNKLFEERRLLNTIESNYELGPKNMIEEILLRVDNFTEGIEQSDDITIEVVEYRGKGKPLK
ncbi:MAG TPA: SpoIIE family protein phosphatase [Victivallales bacterium]|nr:SpoIIE family protein phosphatase [Victivallales bacterium]